RKTGLSAPPTTSRHRPSPAADRSATAGLRACERRKDCPRRPRPRRTAQACDRSTALRGKHLERLKEARQNRRASYHLRPQLSCIKVQERKVTNIQYFCDAPDYNRWCVPSQLFFFPRFPLPASPFPLPASQMPARSIGTATIS